MVNKHKDLISDELFKAIDGVCVELDIDTEQFLDYFCGDINANISRIANSFINYNEADGWHNYHRK